MNLTDKVNKAKALQVFVRFFKKKNQNVKTIAVGDNYNDLDMLKVSDFPCLVFNDKFTLDQIPINDLITTNKPSPEGWADVIKMALVKINKN
ncbi:HAD hydrolase family protein [Candidatus Pelagibacter sp.]|nr:HAD hydrolase family protein [Candidatus Pelagibacter sp.]